uniref:Uncharacterized protein n=1 Tax=Erythrolobus madagascarensis TaxID=708628 RepID=A0A7S0XJG1_9RHOD|mmetsp:Transcript_400/g.783  ORF Transcript_400/g.783 Transcript_400/m.783 type:complete len:265 (+) Transcript_400:61-855(+)
MGERVAELPLNEARQILKQARRELHVMVYSCESGLVLANRLRRIVAEVHTAVGMDKNELRRNMEEALAALEQADGTAEVAVEQREGVENTFVSTRKEMENHAKEQLVEMQTIAWQALGNRVSAKLLGEFEKEFYLNLLCPVLNPNMKGASRIAARLHEKYLAQFRHSLFIPNASRSVVFHGIAASETQQSLHHFKGALEQRTAAVQSIAQQQLIELSVGRVPVAWWKQPIRKKFFGMAAKLMIGVLIGAFRSRRASPIAIEATL